MMRMRGSKVAGTQCELVGVFAQRLAFTTRAPYGSALCECVALAPVWGAEVFDLASLHVNVGDVLLGKISMLYAIIIDLLLPWLWHLKRSLIISDQCMRFHEWKLPFELSYC